MDKGDDMTTESKLEVTRALIPRRSRWLWADGTWRRWEWEEEDSVKMIHLSPFTQSLHLCLVARRVLSDGNPRVKIKAEMKSVCASYIQTSSMLNRDLHPPASHVLLAQTAGRRNRLDGGESAAAAGQSRRRREGEGFASIDCFSYWISEFSDTVCNPLFPYMSHSPPGRGREVQQYPLGIKGWMLQMS